MVRAISHIGGLYSVDRSAIGKQSDKVPVAVSCAGVDSILGNEEHIVGREAGARAMTRAGELIDANVESAFGSV